MKIREYLKEHNLVTDGAMGTYFDTIETDNYLCSEEANLADPSLILRIHREYMESGAQLLRSNTFLANRNTYRKLKEKNKELYENISYPEFVASGYFLAGKAAKEGTTATKPIFAAADIGPIFEDSESEERDILSQYYEICDIFLDAGAELFVIETFPDCQYVLKMAEYIKKKKTDAFIIGQFILTPSGYSRTGFHYKTILNEAAGSGYLDGIGLNCGIGAAHMKKFLTAWLEEYELPDTVYLTALPNCGYPQIVRGRAVFSDSVSYFGEKSREISELGVRILGGCCGTTPEYISLVCQSVSLRKMPVKIVAGKSSGSRSEKRRDSSHKEKNIFREKIEAGKTVYAVELDPPFDADDAKLLEGAQKLASSRADIITIADSPLARSRADSIMMAVKVKEKTGMDVMPHLSCRDKNRIGMRSSLLGGYVNAIRNFLLVTGDPVAKEEQEYTKSVFDFNSIRLMKFLQSMNQEVFHKDPVFFGGALNQNVTNIDTVVRRMEKKMEAGCSYFLTQPVYSREGIEKIANLKERTGAKILIGIMPLVSRRNALFIKNEMPGICVPEEMIQKYREGDSREAYEETAIRISEELIREGKEAGAGFYFMTPFNRVNLIKSILDEIE